MWERSQTAIGPLAEADPKTRVAAAGASARNPRQRRSPGLEDRSATTGKLMETFKKRQKEMQRLERAREKAAKRVERKLHRGTMPDPETILAEAEAEAAAEAEAEAANAAVEPRAAER